MIVSLGIALPVAFRFVVDADGVYLVALYGSVTLMVPCYITNALPLIASDVATGFASCTVRRKRISAVADERVADSIEAPAASRGRAQTGAARLRATRQGMAASTWVVVLEAMTETVMHFRGEKSMLEQPTASEKSTLDRGGPERLCTVAH